MRLRRHGSPFAGKFAEPGAARPIALKSEIPEHERDVLSGAEQRISRMMYVFAAGGVLAVWTWSGWTWGAGFSLGAILSILNFYWLKSAVTVISDAFLHPSGAGLQDASERRHSQPRKWVAVLRFIFRYALIGIVGYGIFLSSAISLMAFLGGLFVPVAALMAEAAYQVFEVIFGANRNVQ
jgi:hypothetical protein